MYNLDYLSDNLISSIQTNKGFIQIYSKNLANPIISLPLNQLKRFKKLN